MARTLSVIYNQLTASKETNVELDEYLPNPDNWNSLYTNDNFRLLANTIVKGLSVSKVAIWRLIMFSVAYAIFIFEGILDIAYVDIDELTENRVFGQLPFYVAKAKEFQLGDDLMFINDTYYGYTDIDATKKIITQASATVSQGVVLVKVAKGEVGSFEKLSTTELNALTVYFKGSSDTSKAKNGIAPAGSAIDVISGDPDDMKMHVDVFVDPLVIDINGFSVSDQITKPVEVAVTSYIQQLPFDATFTVSGLTDSIQGVNGVRNVAVKNCDAKQGAVSYTNVINEEGRQYIATNGYLQMATNFELDGYYDYPTNTLKTLNYKII